MTALGALLGVLCLIGFYAWPTDLPTPSPIVDAWHTAIETSIAGGDRLRKPDPYDPTTISGIWIVYQGAYGNSASPANMALFVRITNIQQKEDTIESITYEALGLNTGRWEKLTHLPLLTSRACYGFGDLQGASMLDFSQNGLDIQLSNRAIKPNESVRGWQLLEYPDGFALSGVPLRCTVRDILGREQSTVLPFPAPDASESGVMTRGLVLTGRVDLSSYHRDYWSNMHAH